jgi:hypothetical protein
VRISASRSSWIAFTLTIAIATWLFASPARAGDEFERGFKDELGRIAAHEAVGAGKLVLAHVLLGDYAHVTHRDRDRVRVVERVRVVRHVERARPHTRHRHARHIRHAQHRHAQHRHGNAHPRGHAYGHRRNAHREHVHASYVRDDRHTRHTRR